MPAPRALAFLVAALAATLLTGCAAEDLLEDSAADAKPTTSTTGKGEPLAKALQRLRVQAEHEGGYDREDFEHWIDAGGDGCDTRAEVLLASSTTKARTEDGCRVTGGKWTSYYDDESVSDPSDLDIDHMVPLAEAWRSGAHTWSPEKRTRYANDLDGAHTLLAVTATTNRSKGDKDPADWLPPHQGAHCRYAAEWVGVKLRWKLTIDRAEHQALDRLAGTCPEATVAYTPA